MTPANMRQGYLWKGCSCKDRMARMTIYYLLVLIQEFSSSIRQASLDLMLNRVLLLPENQECETMKVLFIQRIEELSND